MRNLILIVALSLTTAQIAVASAGTSSASFLKMGAGARAAAMGESFVSVADDATATYWNPAGLAQVQDIQVSAMQNTHFVDTQYQHLAAVKPLEKFTLGLSLARMDYGSIDSYSAGDVRDGNFNASSLGVGLSAGMKMGETLAVGSTVRFIQESIESESATGFAADLGLQYTPSRITFAGAVQNIGTSMKMVQESAALPLTVRLGASTKILEEKLLLSAGLSKPNDASAALQMGVEFNMNSLLTLRGGYKLVSGASDLGGLVGVTGGLGVKFNRFNVDYAVTPFGDLGLSHRVSLMVRFNSGASH
jgi:hypothetical protein